MLVGTLPETCYFRESTEKTIARHLKLNWTDFRAFHAELAELFLTSSLQQIVTIQVL